MTGRRGFSLVEVMIVALLGALMVLTSYQVLITNQDTYRARDSRSQLQRSTRAAMDILFSELREVSVRDGDILSFQSDEIRFRAMTTVGVVCSSGPFGSSRSPTLRVRRVSGDFQAGDSVVVFADNDPRSSSDDVWIKGRISSVDTTAVCPDGTGTNYEAVEIEFGGQSETFLEDSVQQGAPMRAFNRYAYGLTTYGGEDYLGRSEAGGRWSPLVGPLVSAPGGPGLRFGYFAADGSRATDPDNIARIDITLLSRAKSLAEEGGPGVDTLSTSVYLRN